MTNPNYTPEEQEVPLPPAPALPFTIDADAVKYRQSIGTTRIVVALGITIIFWVRLGPLGWLISVVSIAALIWLIIFLITRRSITIDGQGVHYKGSFGAKKSIHFDEIKSVEVFDNYIDPGFGAMPRIIIAPKSGGYFFSIAGIFWPNESMAQLLSSLRDNKVALNFYTEPIVSAGISKQFPQLVPFYERHPYLVAVIASAVLFAVIIAAVLIFMV